MPTKTRKKPRPVKTGRVSSLKAEPPPTIRPVPGTDGRYIQGGLAYIVRSRMVPLVDNGMGHAVPGCPPVERPEPAREAHFFEGPGIAEGSVFMFGQDGLEQMQKRAALANLAYGQGWLARGLADEPKKTTKTRRR